MKNDNTINAEQFGVFVARLSDLDDYNFKRVIKVAKQFRKAQRMLEDEQIRIKEDSKKVQRSKDLKYFK